jgi:DNA replication protein DnaC
MPVTKDGASGVARCECYKRGRSSRLLEYARIPPRYKDATLDNYRPGENPWLNDAFLTAQIFVKDYPTAMPTGLLFMGTPGLGKTHLAIGIIKALIERGWPCLFCDFPDLLREIQNSYNPLTHGSEKLILAPILDADVLVLDDLGCQKWSEWVQDILGHVINDRYSHGHVTIFTTNYLDPKVSTAEEVEALAKYLQRLRENEIIDENGNVNKFKMKELERLRIPVPTLPQKEDTLEARIGDRLRSRLNEMCKTVKMRGEDYRKIIDRNRKMGEISRGK